MLPTLWTDIRYTLRLLSRRPGFFFVIVLTLALGIGSTTAVFSLVNGVLLRPLPYEEPARILTLWQTKEKGDGHLGRVAPGNFLSWQAENRAFEGLASAEPFGFDLDTDGEPERVGGWLVSPGFFRILGVEAIHGRTFSAEEEENADGETLVVLSHRFWQSRFGGDPGAVGQDLLLGGEPHRITGVMPEAFDFPAGRDLWVARVFGPDARNNRSETNLTVIGRLAEGATETQAVTDLGAISARLAELHPTTNRGIRAATLPIEEHILGDVRPGLSMLLFAVAFVHLIVCANVGNLVLVQGLQRRSELACRAALGAGRGRLLAQMLTESTVLSLLGILPGMVLAQQGVRFAAELGVVDVPRLAEVSIDARVLAFAIALAFVTGLVFGLLPNLRLSRPDIVHDLGMGFGSSGSGWRGPRGKRLLIAVEVALAVVLLVGTGLLIRSFDNLLSVDTGFETENLAVLETHVWSRFPAPHMREAFFEQTLDRLVAMPGVQAAGAVSALPLFRGRAVREIPFFVEDREPPTPDQQPTALHTLATTDYFRTLGIPLVQGRGFTSLDRAGSQAVA
ncbi:MAG: ABC transporter permease, partial [Holophagales bacterium]|nr:ABC transporter permease [Holophagales bacterium]